MFTPHHMSHVICHMSHVRCQVSGVRCHMSCLFFYFIYFFRQSGEASRWRVCYQRGLTPSSLDIFIICPYLKRIFGVCGQYILFNFQYPVTSRYQMTTPASHRLDSNSCSSSSCVVKHYKCLDPPVPNKHE